MPPVLGDAGQLQQVVTHLLANALDAGGRRGDVEIETATDTDDVLIIVRDRGTGIPEEHLTRLYDPFFTTKEEGKGRGLGLAVVYAIVQEHGGQITAAQPRGRRRRARRDAAAPWADVGRVPGPSGGTSQRPSQRSCQARDGHGGS